jgi:VWFA-related protein
LSSQLLPALAACLLPFIWGRHCAAQETKQPPAPPATFEVNVNKVLVQVVVRDKQGRVVGDLKREDFQVFDNDKSQPVSGFLTERRALRASSADGSSKLLATSGAAPPSHIGPQRFVVFLFDDTHLSFEDLAHAKKAGTKVLTEALADADMAAVVSVSGETNSGLTRDGVKLKDAIMSLQPRGVYRTDGSECPNIDYYQADQIQNKHDAVALEVAIQQVISCAPKTPLDLAQRMAEMAAMRALNLGQQDIHETFSMTSEIVRRMAGLPGQSTLILVSPGFLTITQEALTQESHLIDLAAQSNVIISALDARGLYTTELAASEKSPGSGNVLLMKSEYRRRSGTGAENVMSELADGTGGTYFHNSNDLDTGFKELTTAPECVYLLEFTPDHVKQTGSYHRLKVKVDRDGLQLQTRHGYFAPKPEKKKK